MAQPVGGDFVGGLAGLLIATARTLLDDRLVSPEVVAGLTNLSCVTTLPQPGIFCRRGNLLTQPRAPAGFDPFLQPPVADRTAGAKMQIIGFTPARKRERASQVVADLAVMLARAGRRTLVVDLHFCITATSQPAGHQTATWLGRLAGSNDALENYIWPGGDARTGLALDVRRARNRRGIRWHAAPSPGFCRGSKFVGTLSSLMRRRFRRAGT